jgi:threonine dehydrogenase-like Zn-dependent dehydrogenase
LSWTISRRRVDGRRAVRRGVRSDRPAALTPTLKLATPHGRVVALGSTRGLVEQFDLYGDVHLPGITLIGAHAMTAPQQPNFANRWTEEANRALALRLLVERRVDVDSLVSHREPPERGLQLFALLAERRAEAMGVVLDWRESR